MAYIGKIACCRCRKEFEYFCLPYCYEIEDSLNNNIHRGENVERAQMCLEYVNVDGIPEYTAHCLYCDWVNKLPESDAVKIPAIYFEGFHPQSE